VHLNNANAAVPPVFIALNTSTEFFPYNPRGGPTFALDKSPRLAEGRKPSGISLADVPDGLRRAAKHRNRIISV